MTWSCGREEGITRKRGRGRGHTGRATRSALLIMRFMLRSGRKRRATPSGPTNACTHLKESRAGQGIESGKKLNCRCSKWLVSVLRFDDFIRRRTNLHACRG